MNAKLTSPVSRYGVHLHARTTKFGATDEQKRDLLLGILVTKKL